MNTLRKLFAVLFMMLCATAARAAEPAHDHSHAAPATAAASHAAPKTMAAPNVVQQDEAAVMARMHARMGEILRETDPARRLQLMELQMRDRDALVAINPNGEACHMVPGGKPGMGGMSMPGRPGMGPQGGMMGAGKPCKHCPEQRPVASDSCPMHPSGASCQKCDAVQQRLKAIEQRLDALERAAKPTAK